MKPNGKQIATVASLLPALNAAFPERAEVIRASLTASVAGEHVLMLGPPGTAKSLLVRTLAGAFGSSYFELLMTRFTTPDEVFGPVKLSALQADRFSRAYEAYLPGKQTVFLDEVFKSNSAILNALLTLLNERKFHDDGVPIDVPLITCFGASNELPEGPELDALYDRFLVRVVTDYIADRDAFKSMLVAPPIAIAAHVDIEAEQNAARAVAVSDDTITALVDLRSACRAAGIIVSDRRWRQSLSLVRAAAHIDGRAATEADDLEVLEHVLWKKPDERMSVARTIQQTVNPAGAKAVEELDSARDLLARLPSRSDVDAAQFMAKVASTAQDVDQILKRLQALPAGRKVTSARAEVSKIKKQVTQLVMNEMGIAL